MTQADLVAHVSLVTGLTKQEVRRSLDAVLLAMCEELRRGRYVKLPNFGVFEVRKRKAREGVNPKTGQTMVIPEHRVVKFRPSKKII